MSASSAKAHYRYCKDFHTLAYRFYDLDNLIATVNPNEELDPEVVDDIFERIDYILQATATYTDSLTDLMANPEVQQSVKNQASFVATVVKSWSDKARMYETTIRRILAARDRTNIDDALMVLDQMVEDYESEDDEYDDEDGLDGVEEEDYDSDDEEDGEEYDEDEGEYNGIPSEFAPEDDDAESEESDDGDAENTAEDEEEPSDDAEAVGDGEADSEGVSAPFTEEYEGTVEPDAISEVEDPQAENPFEDIDSDDSEDDPDAPIIRPAGPVEVDAPALIEDDEVGRIQPGSRTEKRYSADDILNILTTGEGIPEEIKGDIARHYVERDMAVPPQVEPVQPQQIAVNEPTEEPKPKAEEPVSEPAPEKPRRRILRGKKTDAEKPAKKRSTGSGSSAGGTRRSNRGKKGDE